jgi:hypothetical protein
MSTLAWTDKLVLNQPTLDTTHEEFVGLLNAFGTALDEGIDALPAYHALLTHTEVHFAMEEDWMARCGFEPQNILRTELVDCFPQHAEMMDAALVFTMAQRGFDPVTGECRELAIETTSHAFGSGGCATS